LVSVQGLDGLGLPVISTNDAANASLNYLNDNSRTEASILSKLASGSRIVNASDDASGLAIGTQLQASAAVLQQDQVNIAQGLSLVQTADAGLAQIAAVLARMMALATEAASGQVTNTQRSQDINTEYQQLAQEINSIASSTQYGGQSLLYQSNSVLNNFFLAQEYINAQPQGNLTPQQQAIEAKYAPGFDGLPALSAGTTTVGPFNSGSFVTSPFGPTVFLVGTSSATTFNVTIGAANTTALGLDSDIQSYIDQPNTDYGSPIQVTPADPATHTPATYRPATLADWEAANPGQALLGLVTPASASVVSNVASQSAAMLAVSQVNGAIGKLTAERAKMGGYESQFNFASQDIATNVQNTNASASVILDCDVAAEKMQLSATDVRTKAAIAALTQAAQLPRELLKLIDAGP
jgi:flagellin